VVQLGDDTSWSLLEVISGLKLSLRLAKEREQSLEDELFVLRALHGQRSSHSSTATNDTPPSQTYTVRISTPAAY